MATKETDLLNPLLQSLVAVANYKASRGADAPYELTQMELKTRGLIGQLAKEGTLESQKEFLTDSNACLVGLYDTLPVAKSFLETLFDAYVLPSDNDDETPNLTKIGEQMEMRDLAITLLAPHIHNLAHWGHPININETICITKKFCLVTNGIAIIKVKDEDGLLLCESNAEPVKIDLSAEPQENDSVLKVAKLFDKVVTGEYKPTDCAKEIVAQLDLRPRDIFPFNHV